MLFERVSNVLLVINVVPVGGNAELFVTALISMLVELLIKVFIATSGVTDGWLWADAVILLVTVDGAYLLVNLVNWLRDEAILMIDDDVSTVSMASVREFEKPISKINNT